MGKFYDSLTKNEKKSLRSFLGYSEIYRMKDGSRYLELLPEGRFIDLKALLNIEKRRLYQKQASAKRF